MIIKNNRGYVVTCHVCKTENLQGSFNYTPAFSDAIDTVYIGYCTEHKQEAQQERNKQDAARMRLQDQDS